MADDARPPGELNESPASVSTTEAGPPLDDDDVLRAEDVDDVDSMVELEDATDAERVPRRRRSLSRVGAAIAFGLVTVAALATLGGWLGFRAHQAQESDQVRNELLEAARQGAINLTTVDYQHADTDIQRILDTATGEFYDDFKRRSQPFVDVVKQAQSTSQGTVTGAGIESETPQGADVLVAVTVKTSNAGAAEQDPRLWRMRLSIQRVGDQAKVENVAFVP